jgi:hypothetical protein
MRVLTLLSRHLLIFSLVSIGVASTAAAAVKSSVTASDVFSTASPWRATSFTATAIAGAVVRLDWSTLAWATNGYHITRRLSSQPASSAAPLVDMPNVTDHTYSDSTASDAVSYIYTIAGINSRSVTGPGLDSSVVTADGTPPGLTLTVSPKTVSANTAITITIDSDETLQGPPTVTLSGTCINGGQTLTLTGVTPTGQATTYTANWTVPSNEPSSCTATASAIGTDLAGNTDPSPYYGLRASNHFYAGPMITASFESSYVELSATPTPLPLRPTAVPAARNPNKARRGTVSPDTFTIDRTPPKTTLSGKYSGDWYTTSPTITLGATDDLSGVAATYYQLLPHGSASPNTSLPGKWLAYTSAFSPVSDGDFDLWAMSVDQVGNKERPTLLHQLRIDTTPPTPPLGLRANAGEDNIRLTWTTASDATSGLDGYAVYLDQTASCPEPGNSSYRVVRTTMNTSVNLSLAKGKAYCFYVVVSDAAGLQSEPSNVASASIAAAVPTDVAPAASQPAAPAPSAPAASAPTAPAASAPSGPATSQPSTPASSQPAAPSAPVASQPGAPTSAAPAPSAPAASQPAASQPPAPVASQPAAPSASAPSQPGAPASAGPSAPAAHTP